MSTPFDMLRGFSYANQMGEEGRQRGQATYLNRLAGEAYGAAPEQRQSALARLVGADAQTGTAMASHLEQGDEAKRKRQAEVLARHARVAAQLPPDQLAAAWPTLRSRVMADDPELGAMLSEQYDEATVRPILAQFAGESEAGGVSVRSSFVGADGNMYSIMSDGSVKAQGVGADRKLQAFDVPGVGPQVVDLRNATARTVTSGGGAPQQAPASTFAFTPAPGTEGDPDAEAFQNLPPDQQAVAARMLQQKQDFSIQDGRVVPSGMRGGQPMAQPVTNAQPSRGLPSIMALGGGEPGFAPPGSPAWVRPASGGRGDAGAVSQLSPQEVSQLGLPEGTVAQRGPDGKVTTIFTPDAGSRKAAREAATKLPRVDAAMRRVDRLSASIDKIAGGFFDGGPMDQKLLQYTPDGQEVTQAAASLLPELTALTRVPGIGSQSDLETRLANLQLPSLEFPPEVNRRALAELRTFMQDLAEVYRGLAEGNGTQPAQAAPEDDEDALIGKYL